MKSPTIEGSEAYLGVALAETHAAIWQPAEMGIRVDQGPDHVLHSFRINDGQERDLRSERIP
jgi:hypothetical protein